MLKNFLFSRGVKVGFLKDEFLDDAVNLIEQHPKYLWGNDKKLYREQFLEYLLNPHTKKLKVITAEKDKKLLGLVCIALVEDSLSYYQIELLVVAKDFQGQGLGTRLVKDAFKKAKELGGTHVYLLTSNEHYNERALKFYKKLGFEKAGVLPDYYVDKLSGRIDDCSIFFKKL